MKSFFKTFDLTHGLLGAIGMGTIVFLVNMQSSMHGGIQAALAQATISFLIVGTNTGVFKKLCHNKKILAIFVPTLFTTMVATLIHYVTNTPELLWTILVVFLSGAFHFSMLTVVYTRFGTVDPKHLFVKK